MKLWSALAIASLVVAPGCASVAAPTVPLWPGVLLPYADNAIAMGDGPIVVLRGDQLTLDGELAGTVTEVIAAKRMQRLDELYNLLKARREAWKVAHPGGTFRGEVSFVIDGSVPAIAVKSVFQTAAFAGYPNASFVVRTTRPGLGGVGRLPVDAQVPGPPGPGARLPPEVVKQIILASSPALKGCYEAAATHDATLRGTIVVGFEIDRTGHVSSVGPGTTDPLAVAMRLTSGTPTPPDTPRFRDAAVESCVFDVFKTLVFPKPDGDRPVRVAFPIKFGVAHQ